MKLAHPVLDRIFDFEGSCVHTLIIESPDFFRSFLSDICGQMNGREGEVVLSEGEKILDISSRLEIITDFVTFDINQKGLITKMLSAIEKKALDGEHYLKTNELLQSMELYASELFFDAPCQLSCAKLSIANLLKSMGIAILDDFESIPEKIVDYMSLVYEFDREKLFVTVNMRSFFGETVMNEFVKTVIDHGIRLLMLENRELSPLENEKRIIIDCDMCEI